MILGIDEFEKGLIMELFTRSAYLRLLLLFIIVLMPFSVAVAEDEDAQGLDESAVRTTLGQKMQKEVSVEFSDTPIEQVIRIMADDADVDVITSPKVTGNVTAKLTNVPLEEALNNILATHGYAFVEDKSMLRIMPVEEIAQIGERIVSRIYRIHYANVSQVKEALEDFISAQGSLSCSPGTSNIIVTDVESKIRAMDAYVDEIDRITPQILVEARIYDISSTEQLDLGVEWYAGRRTGYTGGITAVGTDPTNRTNNFITGAFNSAISSTAKTDGLVRFGILNSSLDIDVLLSAEQEKVCAKLLANPRILVLDNEKAIIKSVEELPYQELTQTAGGGNIGTTEFKEAGVELEVTPHIARNGMVRVYLKPKFSVKTDEVEIAIPQVGASPIISPQPVINTREVETSILIQDGQTIVIGGLRKQDTTQRVSKVPLLGDIPLVGSIFKFEGEESVDSELVVFITPKIVIEPVMTNNEQRILEATNLEDCQFDCEPRKVGSCTD